MFHTSPRLDALYMLASDVALAPFKIYDKKGLKFDKENTEPIKEHPIYDILENPMPNNTEMDGYILSFLTEVYLQLIGEAFWVMERSKNGMPAEVYPIPPNWMLSTPTTNVPYYFIVPLGNTSHKPLPIQPEDVIWFKEPDITSPFGRGRARTEAIGDELEADEFAAKYGKNFFYNDATPPIVIEAPGATADMVDRFKESWVQKVGGYLNARKPAVLPWKDAKITKLADNPREMDFVESRRFLRDLCNQHWALPPELMGILENSNRSTIDSAYYLWTKNVVSKRLARRESILNRQFVPMFDKNISLKYDNTIPEDEAFGLQRATTGLGASAITVDEWRHASGMTPLPNGRGDVLLRTFSVTEVPVTKVKAEEGEPVAPAENIQQTALNGAQIASLLALATAVSDGSLTRESARAIAIAAFPMTTREEIDAIFSSLVEGATKPPVAIPSDVAKILTKMNESPDELGRFSEEDSGGGSGESNGESSSSIALKLTANDKEGLEAYTSGQYSSINNALRSGDFSEPEVLSTIDKIDSAISKAEVVEGKFYRGAGASLMGHIAREAGLTRVSAIINDPSVLEGASMVEEGYLSTSKSSSIAEKMFSGKGGVVFELSSSGVKGLEISQAGLPTSEDEVVFRRGSKITITKVTYSSAEKLFRIKATVTP
jgi:HK97 family phage portal protein